MLWMETTGRSSTLPVQSIRNSTRSPAARWRCSRTSSGSVIWPSRVIVLLDILTPRQNLTTVPPSHIIPPPPIQPLRARILFQPLGDHAEGFHDAGDEEGTVALVERD